MNFYDRRILDSLEDKSTFFLHFNDVIGKAKNNKLITCLSIDGKKIEGDAPISKALNTYFLQAAEQFIAPVAEGSYKKQFREVNFSMYLKTINQYEVNESN